MIYEVRLDGRTIHRGTDIVGAQLIYRATVNEHPLPDHHYELVVLIADDGEVLRGPREDDQ